MDTAARQVSSVKTLFTILTLFINSTLINPQITVEQSDFLDIFSPGEPLLIVQGESGLINIGKDGGPNIYDFTFIDLQTMFEINNYQVSAIPILAARYPSTAHTFGASPQNIVDNPVIYSSNDSSFFIGAATIEDKYRFTHYSPYELYSVFPMNYGSGFSQFIEILDTTYNLNWQVTQTSFYTSQQEMTVDGYGTLKLPGMDLECLRQKRDYADYGHKDFHFITREGVLLVVDHVPISEPDTGIVNGDYQLMLNELVSAEDKEIGLMKFKLEQNYPNPFNPSTRIKFNIPKDVKSETRDVTLKVYDVLGNEIASLVNEELSPGEYEVEFNGHSDKGQNLPSGVYFYQLRIRGPETSSGQGMIQTKKMLLLK